MFGKSLSALVFIVAIVTAGGCDIVHRVVCVSPAELESAPGKHYKSELCVQGTVSQVVDWPGTPTDYYKVVGDRGGAVWVQGSSPPPKGSRVVVEGKFLAGEQCKAWAIPWVVCETGRELQ